MAHQANAAGSMPFLTSQLERVRSAPGAGYAIAGLALSICASEVWRYPIAMDTITGTSPFPNLLIALALYASALLLMRGRDGFLQRPSFVGSVAVLSTVCLYGYFMSSVPAVEYASRLVFSVASIMLFVSWITVLYKKTPAVAATLLIGSLGLVFCFQAAVSLLSQAVVKGTCALFPCFSALFFLLHKGAETRSVTLRLAAGEAPLAGSEAFKVDPKSLLRENVGFTLIAAVALCHGMLFAQLHLVWLPVQDTLGAFAIQLSSAAGSLVAFVALLIVSPTPDRRMSLLLCESLVLVFSFFAMWLSTALTGHLSVLYLTMMNAAQKTLIYLVFFACLALPGHATKVAAMCAIYGTFRLGTPIVRVSDMLFGAGDAGTVVSGVLMLVSLTAATVILVLVMANPSLLPPLAVGRKEERAGEPSAPAREAESDGRTLETEHYKKIAFYFLLGQKYNLTQREIELLPLLTQHQNARSIADELSISQATAKTHIRNIYAKLDVHTQEDLVSIIEHNRVSLFEQLPSWYLKG